VLAEINAEDKTSQKSVQGHCDTREAIEVSEHNYLVLIMLK
jgi:hypothetical protein